MSTNEAFARFEFTPEQVEILHNNGGEPVHVQVKETNKVYLVIEQGEIPTLDDDYIRQGLEEAARAVERGEVADWDVEEIKAAGRALFDQRRQQS